MILSVKVCLCDDSGADYVCTCVCRVGWMSDPPPLSSVAWKWFQRNCISVIASCRQLGFPIIVLKQSRGHVMLQAELHAQPFCVSFVEADMHKDSESKYDNLSCWGRTTLTVVWCPPHRVSLLLWWGKQRSAEYHEEDLDVINHSGEQRVAAAACEQPLLRYLPLENHFAEFSLCVRSAIHGADPTEVSRADTRKSTATC